MTPLNCTWCDEPVLSTEQHPDFDEPFHFECAFRSVAGSLAHLARRCSCFVPGSDENDPPGFSKREAAKQVLEAYRNLETWKLQ